MRKKYHYRVIIQSLDSAEEGKAPEVPVTFKTENHDNIFAVIRRSRKRLPFDDATATSFAVGLKLLTEVLLENRNDPLFEELKPAMVLFMKKLKGQLKAPVQPVFSPDKPHEGQRSGESLGIKESVEKRIQEIEQKSIAFSEIEVSSIEEMDDELMAEFENSIATSGYQDEIKIETEEDGDVLSVSTISDDFSLSSQVEDTQYTLIEKIGDDGVLEEIELLEVDEERMPEAEK
ncbi:MAG: DUF3861 domain-containing protein [Saezia sp.]